MSAPDAARIAAVVVVARGREELPRALERAAWADERVVLDPADRAAGVQLPAHVVRIVDPGALDRAVSAPWVVLLGEDEVLDDRGVRAVRGAIGHAGGEALALGVMTRTLALELASAPSILVAPRGTPIVVQRGAAVGFDGRGLRVRRIDASVVRERGHTLTTALEILDGDAATAAALADRSGRTGRGVVWRSAAAMVRVLLARSPAGPLGLGRWVLAVLDGYRVVVSQAKLWERRRDHPVEVA
ncbi:MAG TPA: hypothetical protein VMS22_24480 [Candidatus Eisenbacteria bacterium]|nr:hypothetical protein [Candidatus Eisenbacteria bacterium]